MTEAVFGLVGVVVGGVLTGIVQAVQQSRADRIETRAGARLVSAELSGQQTILAAYLGGEVAGFETLPAITEWPQYRAAIARALDDDDWVNVAGAYTRLALLRSNPDGASFEGIARPQWIARLVDELDAARGSLQAFRRR